MTNVLRFSQMLLMAMGMLIGFTAEASASQHLIFIVQLDRPEAVLRKDAQLIGDCVQAAQPGDLIEAFTTDGGRLLTVALDPGLKKLFLKRAKTRAIAELRGCFLELFDTPASQEVPVDIALSLTKAIQRLNATEKRDWRRLVLMSSGVQRTQSVDWTGNVYPGDGWVRNRRSPFASIPHLRDSGRVDAIFLAKENRFLDAYHVKGYARFYTLLFHEGAME